MPAPVSTTIDEAPRIQLRACSTIWIIAQQKCHECACAGSQVSRHAPCHPYAHWAAHGGRAGLLESCERLALGRTAGSLPSGKGSFDQTIEIEPAALMQH